MALLFFVQQWYSERGAWWLIELFHSLGSLFISLLRVWRQALWDWSSSV
jgi:hypothetical protein